MTQAEHEQMVKIFWKVCDIIAVMQPDLGRVYNKDDVDTSGMVLDDIDDMVNVLRLNTVYTVFDLEACRRDMLKLVNIIKSGREGENHGT